MKLYKNKYLIAVYDKDGFLEDVFDNGADMANNMGIKKNSAFVYLARLEKGKTYSNRVYLIDVTKKYNDVFCEEDKEFLEFVEKDKKNKNFTFS